jgi:two-component SAPR family response regulator
MQVHLNTVAIIDDDEISLLLIRKFLEQKQAAKIILPFSNGFEALSFLKNNADNFFELPWLILLDITMPGMSGWQFLKELNKIKFVDGYNPAVCIISASETIDFQIFKNYPFIKGYLMKPVIPGKLITIVEQLKISIEANNSVSSTLC